MELTVTQENLARALANVGRVANGNRLLVAATNLEIASTQYIGAKVAKPGAITIPARLVSEFISNLPKGNVELTVKADHLHIVSSGYKSTINGIVADEFPELPTIDEKSSIRYMIKTEDFKQSVTQTILTASNDSTRPVLSGIYWHSFEGGLYLAATDGYRLSEKRLVETKSEVAAIIPATTLQEVLRSLSDDTDEVEVLFDETQVRFRANESEVTSRLIDGNFPDYRQLIPDTSETNIVLSKSDFVRITKVAGLFARESGGSVTLTADSDKKTLAIHSIASQLGENTSQIEAEVDTGGQVTLNSRYLSEALGVVEGEEVTFRFSGKLAPCVLTAKNEKADYKHIIMPLKS